MNGLNPVPLTPSPVRLTRAAASPGDITFLMRCLRQRRRLVALAAVIGLGLGVAAQVALPRHYAATEQLILDYRRLVNVSPQEAVFNFRLSDAAMDSQTEILTSDGILGRTVDTLDLATDPEFIGGDGLLTRLLVSAGLVTAPASLPLSDRRQDAILALRKAVKVERLGLSYVIAITAAAKGAEKTARIADGVTDAYIADQMDARREVAGSALDWFETRLRELQANVTEAEHKAIEYRIANQIMLSGGKFVDEQQVQDLSSRLVAAQERRSLAQARLTRASAIIDGQRSLDGLLPGSLGDELRDPVIVGLLNDYHNVSRRVQQNMTLYGPTHEAVVKGQAEVRSLQDNLVSQFKQIAAGAKSDTEIATSDEVTVGDMLQQAAARAAQAQKGRVELTLLQGAADSMTALRDNFVMQYSMSTQQQTFPITETRVTSRASVPATPSWPTPRKTLVGGLALGLIVGFAWAVGDEALSRRLRKRADLEATTGHKCLGYLPFCAALAGLGRDQPLFGSCTREEAFAAERLRATLLDIERGSGRASGVVVGVVGTRGADGATTTAAALAAAAQAAGRHVLLVDADLLTASLSRRYAPSASRGLIAALADPLVKPVIEDVSDDDGHIACLAAGSEVKDDLRRADLNPAGFARLIDRLRPQFDLILVDLPPLASSTVARMIADALSGYLLVLRWNVTTKDTVIGCLDANPEVEAKLLGSVFNRMSLARADMIDDAALIDASTASAGSGAPRRRSAALRWATNPFLL